ncbi:MAG: mannosyltransferase, partial [Flavobacteriales bacterium]|nr:mannosyltransferase [Flavobacteriales bacterium]
MRSDRVCQALLFFSVLLHFCLAYWVDRSSSILVIGSFGLLWVVFLIQWANWKIGAKQIIALGMLLRLIYLIAVPELSDDVFRYVWDGFQLVNGVSPYEWTPTEWVGQTEEAVFQWLHPLLNSPDYYSIYPPVLQFFYGLSAWLSGGNVYLAIIILRAFVLLAEVGSMLIIWKLLKAWNGNSHNLMLYSLNPLVIAEFSGNLHNEAFMVFFLLLSLYLLVKNWRWLSAVSFALSVGVKLLPLMFLPFFIKRIGLRESVVYGAAIGVALLLMYLPFWSDKLIENNLTSLSLYFANFEFNASIYYIIREIGFQATGYNIIGTTAIWLPRIVLVSVLLLAIFNWD